MRRVKNRDFVAVRERFAAGHQDPGPRIVQQLRRKRPPPTARQDQTGPVAVVTQLLSQVRPERSHDIVWERPMQEDAGDRVRGGGLPPMELAAYGEVKSVLTAENFQLHNVAGFDVAVEL